MSFFKPYESYRAAKSPIEPTDSGYESSSPITANGKKKRLAFDFQAPSWFGRLNKSSRLSIQPGEYSHAKPIRQRFDGAGDDPKPVLHPFTLPRLKRRSSTPELRLADLFRDQDSCIAALKSRFDGSSDVGPVALTLPHRANRSSSSEYRPRSTLKKFQSSDSVRSSGSLRSLDRFLPRRSTVNSASTSFRANKDPQSLCPDEKLLRHGGASADAFNPRRRATSPSPQPTHLTARRNISANRSGGAGPSILAFQREPSNTGTDRQASVGTVWTVGGLAPTSTGVPSGRGGLLVSGTNVPLYTTSFSASRPDTKEELEKHEGRLAEALELDRVTRVLEFCEPSSSHLKQLLPTGLIGPELETKTFWTGTEWVLGGPEHKAPAPLVLDAPSLRDDFYCSILAYSATCHTLAVGLGSLLYAWSEMQGVHLLNGGNSNGSWLTTLAFSSTQGGKSILAFGRSDGSLSLMSLYDSMLPRFEVQQPCPIACITWRPVVAMRPSRSPLSPSLLVKTEDLLVGDEIGCVYYYSVQWPDAWEVTRDGWSGSTTLLARISIHTQQICGLSFAGDGTMFATGGNDNLCCLFQTQSVLQSANDNVSEAEEVLISHGGTRRVHTIAGRGQIKEIRPGAEKHRWVHGAAVKAIAFCPWRDGLVATGGGSNDKCIHFFHTTSGACLATINVAAQVTSLIWSITRREIVATFGYAQPEHPYRIAVFSWPECKQVAAIPWDGEHRALYAISYPGGPNESHTSKEGGRGLSRTAQEGCIVVASSDESVKFHEVWTANQKATTGGKGLLGGSDILEALEGIEKEGEVIR